MMHKAFFLPESPADPGSLPFDREHPWLAPLAGYSDLPFRLLCRRYGAAVCVTEMVSAKGLVYRSPGTGELLQSLPGDQPLVVQLFGAEAPFLQRAVEMLRDAGYGWFDLNMGCSVAKVLKQGAGAAMLGDVPHALEVARAMLQAAGPGRVGFKIRLGLDSRRHVWRDLSLRLQDLGAGWITLHPRTARQGFGGEAAHELLAELKQALDIPLIASGDLFSACACWSRPARTRSCTPGAPCTARPSLPTTSASAGVRSPSPPHRPPCGTWSCAIWNWPRSSAPAAPPSGRCAAWCPAMCAACPASRPCASSSAAVRPGRACTS